MAGPIIKDSYGSKIQETPGSDDQLDSLNTKRQSITTQDEKTTLPDDDEDEDLDALLDDLESHDGRDEEEDDASIEPGGARSVPEELLQTNPEYGLSDAEVTARRKKYGWNQMKEEKENMVLKFLSYFIGPIQFVMEVCESQHFKEFSAIIGPALRDVPIYGIY